MKNLSHFIVLKGYILVRKKGFSNREKIGKYKYLDIMYLPNY